MAASRKIRTAHCDYCDQDYQTTSKPYRGKGRVYTSCSKPECVKARTEAYDADRVRTAALTVEIRQANAARADRPSQPAQRTAYGDYAWMCMLANREMSGGA